MRGIAYRRHKCRNKYAQRVKHIFYSSGGYKIIDNQLVRCESVKDYMESENPYILKSQGNFDHHADIDEKYKRRRQLKKNRRNKYQLHGELH